MSTASLTGSPTELWSASAQTSTHSSVQTGISVDPPRPAKDGYEWVWFPEGYWAERPVARRDSSKGLNSAPAGPVGKLFRWAGKPSKSSMELLQAEQRDMSPRTVVPPFGSPKHLGQFSPATNIPQSPYFSEQAHVQSLQHPTSQSVTYRGDPDTWKSPSSPRRLDSIRAPIAAFISPGEKKTPQHLHLKHAWRAFHKPKEMEEPTEVPDTEPQIGATLDTPSYFTQTAVRGPLTDETEDGEDRAKPPPKGLCKWLKKTSWNRKGVPTSSQTDMASTSIFRNPYKRIDYATSMDPVGGLDRVSHVPVPMPGSTISYPAGEAISVNLPRTKHATTGKPRNHLTDADYWRKLEYSDTSSSSGSLGLTPRVDLYSKDIGASGMPKAAERRTPVKASTFFEFDLPEHLPSSPICPANPKHKLKGKGVCVVHGRGREVSSDAIPKEWEAHRAT